MVNEYNDLDAAIENSSADSMEQMSRIQQAYMPSLMGELMAIGSHALRLSFDPNLAASSEALSQMNAGD